MDNTNQAFPRWAVQQLHKLCEDAKETKRKLSCSPESAGLVPALTLIEIMINKLTKFADNPDIITDVAFLDFADLLPQEFFTKAVEPAPAAIEVKVSGKAIDVDVPEITPVEGPLVDYLCLSDAQRDQIYKLLDMKLSQDKIAGLMNVSRHVVRTVKKRRATPATRQHRLTPEQNKVIAHMFMEKNLSMTKIGDMLNITHVAVGNSLERQGLRMRIRNEAPNEIQTTA